MTRRLEYQPSDQPRYNPFHDLNLLFAKKVTVVQRKGRREGQEKGQPGKGTREQFEALYIPSPFSLYFFDEE